MAEKSLWQRVIDAATGHKDPDNAPEHAGKTSMEIADSIDDVPPATGEDASNSGQESSSSGKYSEHTATSYEMSVGGGRQSQSTDHMNQY